VIPQDAQRWLDEARADFDIARYLLEGARYNACAFHSQQTAEKALKALLRLRGENGWGHKLGDLTERLVQVVPSIPASVIHAAQGLDRHYVESRYPDALESGIPSRVYTREVAEQTAGWALIVLDYVEQQWQQT
jgi:HEPN domain-containing protein